MDQIPGLQQLPRHRRIRREDRPRDVAAVSVKDAPNIDQHELAVLERLPRGSAVRAGGLLAEEDGGPEAPADAGAREERGGGREEGLLGYADMDAWLQGA